MRIIIEMIPLIGIVILTVAYVVNVTANVIAYKKTTQIFEKMEKENRLVEAPIKIGANYLCPSCGECIEYGISHCDICLKRLDWSENNE